MSAVHNEQTKLQATALHKIAVAFAVTGLATPISAMGFGIASARAFQLATAFLVAIWLCAAIGLHWVGRRVRRSIGP